MLLSEIDYEIIKSVSFSEDLGFNIHSFRENEYTKDPEYINAINNVWTPLNMAIHRLSDRRKIPTKIAQLTLNGNIANYGELNVKSIVSIFYLKNNDYDRVDYRNFGDNQLLINNIQKYPLYIEYYEDIKNFSSHDINYDEFETRDIDLKKYGINDTMCSYVIEYSKGKLLELLDPNLANWHLSDAEQYMQDLEDQKSFFSQKKVSTTFKVL